MKIEVKGKHIFGTIVYNLQYDEEKDQYTCTCSSATYGKPCKHLEEFFVEVMKIKKDKVIWGGLYT